MQEESRFVNLVVMNEMLIRIDENVKSYKSDFIEHKISDIAEFTFLRNSINEIRDKLDKFKEDAKKDIVQQTTKQDKQIAFQNRLMGAIAIIAFVVPIVVALWSQTGGLK